jgi:hypothetical protein
VDDLPFRQMMLNFDKNVHKMLYGDAVFTNANKWNEESKQDKQLVFNLLLHNYSKER